MKSLYLRIYATVVVVLLLFAAVSGWVVQQHLDSERASNDTAMSDRLGAWADLIQRSLPEADVPVATQVAALVDWSQRLRIPLALDDAGGHRLGASESFNRLAAEHRVRAFPIKLGDGRTLWTMRPGALRRLSGAGSGLDSPGAPPDDRRPRHRAAPGWPLLPLGLPRGTGLAVVLLVLFVAVSAGAYPVVRRLTRRLEALKLGVEQFGAGALDHRVAVTGRDEVAAVASSFNVAAARVEALVQSHRSLLANASHELRSPLARMKMAVAMLADAEPHERAQLKQEIDRNVAELDALVEEVLLASRLDATREALQRDAVDLPALLAEEAARVGASLDASSVVAYRGDERLLRRAVRNLLENARRYGGVGEIEVSLRAGPAPGSVKLSVDDRGEGVVPALRERIFEPFFRLPGHAEQAGGVGLGLSLVRQIAERHGGSVRCAARDGGGSSFTIELPAPRGLGPNLGRGATSRRESP